MKKTIKSRSIIDQILDHHKVLKNAITVLTSSIDRSAQKQKKLLQFIDMLKMHAYAEEEVLYKRMRTIPDSHVMQDALEGVQEHKIAGALVEELEVLDYQKNWDVSIAAKAKVVAELVEHHVQEEEKKIFPLLKKKLEREELRELGADYMQKCQAWMDENTEKYSSKEMFLHANFL